MANIALLVPNEEIFRQAHDVLQELKKRLDYMKIIETEAAVSEARRAIAQGAEIIIARGLQATIIKQYTDVPVVEIVQTRQGIADMLERAGRIVRKEEPQIALVMFRNMSCDTAGLGEQCGVRLREYYVQNPELLRESAVQAVSDKADLIIGGATALRAAEEAGLPSLYLANTEDAVAAAIMEAFRLADVFEGKGTKRGEAGGRHGAPRPSAPREEPFVNFPYRSERMREAVETARRFAQTDCPKLLLEERGTLYHAFASAMHNHSRYGRERLLQYDCVEGESAYGALFGNGGLAQEAAKGTLQLNFIENLDPRSQKKLFQLLLLRNIIAVAKRPDYGDALLPELYERLRAFCIRIPSLSETPEDILYLAEVYLRAGMERYGKYLVMTKSAERALERLPWQGGRLQLESFLERLLLTAERRSIRDREVETLYYALYGEDGEAGLHAAREARERDTAADRERERLLSVLSENFGNREKTARQLGISKTTLWRKLREYKIV